MYVMGVLLWVPLVFFADGLECFLFECLVAVDHEFFELQEVVDEE